MDITAVLTRSGQLFWRHKILWLFGFLAAAAYAPYLLVSIGLNPALLALFDYAPASDAQTGFLVALIGLSCMTVLLGGAISLVFLNAVVLGTRQADEGAERLSFGGVLRGSLPYFWRVAGLALIFAGAFFAAYVLMVLLFMGIGLATFGLGAICVFPLFILIIPVVYLALALVEQSQISVITGGLGVGAALRRGWQLVTGDVWRYLGLSLILYLVLAFALGLALTLIMIPMFIPMFAAVGSNGQPDQTILALSLACVGLITPFYALIQGMYMAFVRATWTVANLHPKPAPAEAPPAGELLSAG